MGNALSGFEPPQDPGTPRQVPAAKEHQRELLESTQPIAVGPVKIEYVKGLNTLKYLQTLSNPIFT